MWYSMNELHDQENIKGDLVSSMLNLIRYISQYVTLVANELTLTRCPPGIGQHSDIMKGGMQGLVGMKFKVISGS